MARLPMNLNSCELFCFLLLWVWGLCRGSNWTVLVVFPCRRSAAELRRVLNGIQHAGSQIYITYIMHLGAFSIANAPRPN
jgi:hypothetical protein